MTTAVVYTSTDSSLTTMNAAEDVVETVTGSVEEIVDNDDDDCVVRLLVLTPD